jgi:RNA polymerase sigma-70 factor (ECF subfamily)
MATTLSDVVPLVTAARAGSAEALGRLFEACRGYLLTVAEGGLAADVKVKEAASDLVQDTFLEAQRDFARFNGATESELLAWLRRLLLNNVANVSRRYRTGKRSVEREAALNGRANQELQANVTAESDSPSGPAVAKEQAAALARALERLPDDYRRVLRLRYEEGRPLVEIAAMMGRSANAVRKLFARAVERVQQEVESNP